MTVERNQPWGGTGPLTAGAPIFSTDRDASLAITTARASGGALTEIGLVGGDLRRTLGGTHDSLGLRGSDATRVLVDLIEVMLDDVPAVALAHVVIRRRWPLTGQLIGIMNAEFIGRLDVANRSHPGDGRLDVVDGSALSPRQRVQARRRLPLGAHVPHPQITDRRVAAFSIATGGESVYLDGERHRASNVAVRVIPDAITVVV